ncbi:MAG: GTPase [Thermoprotei archaeon]|nr:MAG: GTPase [Thermoprotei archaeon]
MLKIELNKNKLLRIFGPAAIVVSKGSISILGKNYRLGEKAIIHSMRSYVVLALEDSILEITMGNGASLQEPSGNEEPISTWLSVVNEIINREMRKVVILGGVDCGKSSFTILLANIAYSRGLKVAIIDSDVGQADIGPPGFISMSLYNKSVIWMRELDPSVMRFIGDIRPQHYTDRIIYEINRLIEYAFSRYNVNIVVIDTDGWIQDSYAIDYKNRLIERISPDAIVVLGNNSWGIFRRFEKIGMKVYELSSPLVARARTRDERRRLRSNRYRKFLETAPIKRFKMDDLLLSGFPLFLGQEIDANEISNIANAEVYYASRTPDMLHIVTPVQPRALHMDRIREIYGVSKVRVYNPGFEKGLYVAVSSDGIDEYPGIIYGIDFANRTVAIKTLFNGKPKFIRFSRIRLTENYTEQLID